MSLENLKVGELRDIAEFFAIEVEGTEGKLPSKAEVLAALSEGDNPVTWQDYVEVYKVAKGDAEETAPDEPVKEKKAEVPEDLVLIKYEKKNPTWQIGQYTFTKSHPYKAVPSDVADELVTNHKGFRPALPKEIADYYA